MQNEAFNQFYLEIYGERWPVLLASLQGSEIQVARSNGFVSNEDWLRSDLWHGGEIKRHESGLLLNYVMDPASILVAEAMLVEEGDRVLDLCAAPGGKTLILIEKIRQTGELVANEMSATRRDRLTKVIQNYVPRDVRNRVWTSGKDGGLYCSQNRESFDKVLVDAPCSGERHLLANQGELNEWTISRVKKLAQRQYALVSGAIEALKPGGRLVYSTCAINNIENDQVIEKILRKKSDLIEVEAYRPRIDGEKTEFGWIYLPDRKINVNWPSGIGPIYFSVLNKK